MPGGRHELGGPTLLAQPSTQCFVGQVLAEEVPEPEGVDDAARGAVEAELVLVVDPQRLTPQVEGLGGDLSA